MSIKAPLPAVLLSAILLAACVASPQPLSDAERRYAPIFDSVTAQTVLPPTEAGLDALDVFLARNGARHGDRLVVAAAPETVAAIARHTAVTGVKVLAAPVDGADGKADDRTVSVTFFRLIVTPAPCGDWGAQIHEGVGNRPASNWGCANASNLARMVADPHDLQAGAVAAETFNSQADVLAIRAYRARAIELQSSASTSGD